MLRHWRESRRRRQCLAQWLDGCLLLTNALRAGLNLEQAIALAAEELPPPLREEFQHVCRAMAVGRPCEVAFAQLGNRLPHDEVRTVADAVILLRATGGNLIACFERVVAIVRRQRQVASRVRTLTMQGRVTAGIVTAVPIAQLLGMAWLMPHWVAPLVTTPLGWGLLLCAAVLQCIGLVWIRAILRVRV